MECYDPDSGQVYRETIVKHRNFIPWDRKCIGTKPSNALSSQGVDSLTAMVIRKLICHAGSLRPETLEPVPSHIVTQISAAVRRSGNESLHVWKIFVESGHGDKTFMHAARAKTFSKPVVDYFWDITSVAFAWMTNLTLAYVHYSRADLRQLTVLCNLRNLHVRYQGGTSQAVEPFDDTVIQHLAWRASADGALSQLQMIFVRNARGISAKVFEYLSSFPSLDTFGVFGTRINQQHRSLSKMHGWNGDLDTQFMSYVQQWQAQSGYQSTFTNGTSRGFWKLAEGYVDKRRSETTKDACNVPTLDAWFGPSSFNEPADDPSKILCFERDWNFIKPVNHHGYFIQSSRTARDTGSGDPPPKKRKLKHGKAVALDTMLEGL